MKIHSNIEKEVTPKGKRSIRFNVWGNWVGYVSGKRWIDFGCHACAESDAIEWKNDSPLQIRSDT